jgi:GT2 family glycosyltransferase
MSAAPAISVVIPTLGDAAALERVLDGYERQSLPADRFELLLAVDAAAADPGAAEQLLAGRPYPARTVRAVRPGASANRNAGWQAAGAPLVLFTDDDTLPTERLLSEHLSWHQRNPEPGVSVLGLVRWAPELRVSAFMKWLDRGVQFDYPFIEGTEAGWGRYFSANVSSKRELLDRVGGFDEVRFPYGYEDLEFGLRADREGMRLLFNRAAVVDHLRPMTLAMWRKRVARIAVAERRFVARHPQVPAYFHDMFTAAAAGRRIGPWGSRLAWVVPHRLPIVGPVVWDAADAYWRQQLAGPFLAAWDDDEREGPP